MKVFISWSGERSKAVAEALRYWLPNVIQALEPWMSADDIERGTRWRSGVASELEQSTIGIVCLTRENLDSTWIHFEAGALSKQQENTYVCTLLLGLEPTDVREPLAQFQHTRAAKDDLRKLLSTINNTLGDSKRSESQLSETFEVWWPRLEQRLADLPTSDNKTSAPVRGDREILDEILEIVRGLRRGADADSPSRKLRLRLASTANWDVQEADLIFNIWTLARNQLAELKSGDSISENRVHELEEFANQIAKNEFFARTVFKKLLDDPSYYNQLLEPSK